MSEDRRWPSRAHGGASVVLGHGLKGLICAGLLANLTATAALAAPTCDPQAVYLRNPSGQIVRFSVEVADDQGERAIGLMNRSSLARSKGMLFIYDAPKHVAFWMKNTLIPLDMLFANAAGQVTQVRAMAEPMDTTPIDGGEDVQFVLELNGGMAAQLGLVAGSVLLHPAVDPSQAIWPCADK